MNEENASYSVKIGAVFDDSLKLSKIHYSLRAVYCIGCYHVTTVALNFQNTSLENKPQFNCLPLT